MIGAGERVGNTSPPSIALLAYAAAQTGLVLAAAPAASRLLTRPRWWRSVTRLNPRVMLVCLWHMVPVIVAAVALYLTGIMPQPRIGSAEWWELPPAWIAQLAVILVPLSIGLLWVHRPFLRMLPDGLGPVRPWSPAVLLLGLAAAGFGLIRLAIGGFAPGGGLPTLALGACTCGLLLTLLSGPPSACHGRRSQRSGATPLNAEPGPPASPAASPGAVRHLDRWSASQPGRSPIGLERRKRPVRPDGVGGDPSVPTRPV